MMSDESSCRPKLVLILSGKRKSGKDYIAQILLKKIGKENCSLLQLSGFLKLQYSKEHNLDYIRLLDATQYKEHYRIDMIKWGERMRKADPEYFCRHAILQSDAYNKEIWIVSDARRKTDLDFFLKYYPESTHTIRVIATEATRMERGWKFIAEVDAAESECDLDDVECWDFIISNNGTEEANTALLPVFHLVSQIKPF